MKRVAFALYMLVGASLVISGFATREKGLKEDNREVLERINDEYTELGNMGFDGFNPLNYKVAFSNGEKDVVTQCSTNNNGYDGKLAYNISERPAVYEGVVGSVYQNGDEYEVVVPEYDTWITLSAISNQTLSAAIWHESFHAYQNTRYSIMENVTYTVLPETELAQRVDGDSELKRLFIKELETLAGVYDGSEETSNEKSEEIKENTSDIRKIALEYLDIKKERDGRLDDEEINSENFYAMMEGSAYYVESRVASYENGEESYRKNYLDTASKYSEGNAKYYRLGMLECMLLDNLDPEWKTSYNFDRPLSVLIEEKVCNIQF